MPVSVHEYINDTFYDGQLICMVPDDGLFRVLWLSLKKCFVNKIFPKFYSLIEHTSNRWILCMGTAYYFSGPQQDRRIRYSGEQYDMADEGTGRERRKQ